jgi:hypothetical protein
VLAKVCGDFWCVDLILLLMVLFFIYGFSRAINNVYAFFVDGVILVVCEQLVELEWAQKCWSTMGMRGHMSVGPLRACVKFNDYCDSFSTGTLTCVKTIETIVECVLPPNVCYPQ